MKRALGYVLAAVFVAPSVSAQCGLSSLSTQKFGESCNAASTGFCLVVSRPTEVVPTLDSGNCRLDVSVVAFEGCGAKVPLRALFLGVDQANIPVPFFGPTCALFLNPVAVLPDPSGLFSFQLPPATRPFSLLMQGFALSLPPFGSPIATLSDGVRVSVQ